MIDSEKIIKKLESLRDICNAKSNMAIGNGKVAWAGYANMADDAISLLKAQEQEISRLKHHIDCEAAEKIPSGCVGYGRGFNDDEPCETCKACEKYNGYGEE